MRPLKLGCVFRAKNQTKHKTTCMQNNMSSSNDVSYESIKSSNRELQEQELEALRSIYSDEFSRHDHNHNHSNSNGRSDSYQIAIPLHHHGGDDGDDDNNNGGDANDHGDQQNRKLYLQFTYHDRYPSHEPPYFNFETKNWKLSGDDVATLHSYLVSQTCTNSNAREEMVDSGLSCYFTPGECCIFQWVEHLRANVGEMLTPLPLHDAKNDDLDFDNCKTQQLYYFETVGFYFHHIYNAEKKRLIVQHAKNLSLTGLYRYGKPGRVIVEGLQEDVRAYVQQIKV